MFILSAGYEPEVLFASFREHLVPTLFWRLVSESQGQNMALTVLYVPYSIDSGHVGRAELS